MDTRLTASCGRIKNQGRDFAHGPGDRVTGEVGRLYPADIFRDPVARQHFQERAKERFHGYI